MFKNLEVWFGSAPTPPKTVIWTASVHAAKSEKIIPDFEAAPNLGAQVKRRFGDSAFSLGFSSLKGKYTNFRGDKKEIPLAKEDSLEREAFSRFSGNVIFLDSTELERLGSRVSGVVGRNRVVEKNWSLFYDGLVIFREQKPATRERPDGKNKN